MKSKSVPGFLPSTSGFRFSNYFPEVPVKQIWLPLVGTIPIGDASGGLCGGMVYAVRDYFERAKALPLDEEAPIAGSPLFNYLATRLLQSWDIPWGLSRYFRWMQFPDHDSYFSRSVSRRTLEHQWPRIRMDMDQGILSPLGLITLRSRNPIDLRFNHQVLAYGYEEGEKTITIRVYDPNLSKDDSIQLMIEKANDLPVIYYSGGMPVRGFFRTKYRLGSVPESIGFNSRSA
jgi:hypothetical protein